MAKEKGPPHVSGRLREAMQAKMDEGVTKRELASLAGIHESQVGRFMEGKRTLTLPAVDRLCQALDLRLVGKRKR